MKTTENIWHEYHMKLVTFIRSKVAEDVVVTCRVFSTTFNETYYGIPHDAANGPGDSYPSELWGRFSL